MNENGWIAAKEWNELTAERCLNAEEKIMLENIDIEEKEKLKEEIKMINDVRRELSFLYSDLLIPNTVTEIPEHLFDFSFYRTENDPENCSGLKELDLYNIKKIRAFAFCCNANLESITFSNSLKIIERGAFKHCKIKNRISIPDSVEEIEEGAFEDCEATIIISDILYNKFFKNSKSWDREKTTFIVE